MSDVHIDCAYGEFLPSDNIVDAIADHASPFIDNAITNWFALETEIRSFDLSDTEIVCALIFTKKGTSFVILTTRDRQSGIYCSYIFYAPETLAMAIDARMVTISFPDGIDESLLDAISIAIKTTYRDFLNKVIELEEEQDLEGDSDEYE